jgi:DNA gyrase/topoisomerase IV subunit A
VENLKKFADIAPNRKELEANQKRLQQEKMQLEKEIADRDGRVQKAKERSTELEIKLNDLTEKRRAALLEGEPTATLHNETQAVIVEKRDADDLVVALSRGDGSIAAMHQRIGEIEDELKIITEQFAIEQLYNLYDEYNEKASSLAQTVKAIFSHRKKYWPGSVREINELGEGLTANSIYNANSGGPMSVIPKMLVGGRYEKYETHGSHGIVVAGSRVRAAAERYFWHAGIGLETL